MALLLLILVIVLPIVLQRLISGIKQFLLASFVDIIVQIAKLTTIRIRMEYFNATIVLMMTIL
jgi:hypothetical protein